MSRPKQRITIRGVVVPSGSLKPNLQNPYFHQSPEERWQGIVSACAKIVQRVTSEMAHAEYLAKQRKTVKSCAESPENAESAT